MPEIAQGDEPHPHCEGDRVHRSEVVREAQPVVARLRLVEERELGVGPVEAARVDDGAADGRAVAADPFRERVDHDVGPVLDRAERGTAS